MTATRTLHRHGARPLALLAAAALLLALVPGFTGTADAAHFASNTERLRGEAPDANRFGTAATIALEAYPDGADTVVLARADVFADALAGSLVAGAVDGPILLTEGSRLTGVTADTIVELEASTVILLGGEEALSTAVETAAGALDGVGSVARIDGRNRFDTARLIAHVAAGDDGSGVGTTDDGRTAILATGEDFVDALSAGPLAFGGQHPLLLTARSVLSGEAEDALVDLEIDHVLVAGGSAAVSDDVVAAVEALDITVERVRVPGGDRTHTAVAFAELTRELLYEPLTNAADSLAVATGARDSGGVDALALAPLAFHTQADLVVTAGNNTVNGAVVDGVVQPEARIVDGCGGYGAAETPILIAGGTAAITTDAERQIARTAVCTDFVVDGGLVVTPRASFSVVTPDEDTHTLQVAGRNGLDEPAADAVLRFELHREADPVTTAAILLLLDTTDDDIELPPGVTGFLVEGEDADRRVFLEVERDNVQLDSDGRGAFSYTYDGDAAVEDRIAVCALPDEPADDPTDRSCTDGRGDVPEDTPYGDDVVAKHWVTELEGELAFPISGEREVFVDDDGTENPLGAAGGPATGSALVTFGPTGGGFELCLELALEDVTGSFAAFEEATGLPAVHIHEGGFAVNGDVALAFAGIDDDTGTLPTTCVEVEEAELAEIVADPHEYYVNTHTDVFPGGVARGQLDASWDGDDRSSDEEGQLSDDHGDGHGHG